MFETGIRQFRMAMGIVWGRRLNPQNIERLIEDALATLAEFGEPGADVRALTDGPLTDPETREQFATTNIRRTARRLAAQSPFYARRFAAAEVRPDKLDLAGLRAIPVTVKADLIRQPADFLCADAPRQLATRTTGTTGRPTEIWISRYELELWPAIGALASVLRDDFRPTDVMQVNISSRATIAVNLDVAVCRLIGTGCRLLGLVPPNEALDALGEGSVTLLSTTPSYLGELIAAARHRGLGPDDFQLRRIDVGGEVLSPSVEAAARTTFGVDSVNDLFGMTEVLPVTGRTCEQGHLHHDINTGLSNSSTWNPATGGARRTRDRRHHAVLPVPRLHAGLPLRHPRRRAMPSREPLTCDLSGLPAVSKVVGKADQLLHLGSDEIVTPRQLVEAVESLPTQPWPARFRADVRNGRLVVTLPQSSIAGMSRTDAVDHFADAGLAIDLALVPDDEARSLRHCDVTCGKQRSSAGPP